MSQATRKCAQFATLAATVLLYAQAASAATMMYATIEGVQQGMLKGNSQRKGLESKTEVLKFEYSVNMPAPGKRQHGPLKITKIMGPASPQLFQALVTNETLKTVVIDFIGINQVTGMEYLQTSIRLGNAKVVGIEQSSEVPGMTAATGVATSSAAAALPAFEKISFTFSTIEINSLDGKTVAMDSLSSE